MGGQPLLTSTLPDFATELHTALRSDELTELAAQVEDLRIHAVCGCEDSFCTSFYTQPRPDGSSRGQLMNVIADVPNGKVILDVVDGIIRYVEVLEWEELRPWFEQLTQQLADEA